jgi:AcrR family transcriptional regulator
MPTSLPAQRESQQARSSETSRRLLEAAEEILEQKGFDECSVAEIAARAGVTTGAFYARFRDKEAVLQVLEDNLHAALEAVVDKQRLPDHWTSPSVEALLRQHHTYLVQAYRTHRGAARALLLRAHQDPQLRKRIELLNRRNLPIMAAGLAEHGKVKHPGGMAAIEFALLTVRSLCREVVLFGQSWPGRTPPSDAELVEELTRMVMAYLGLRDVPVPRARPE